MIKKVIWCFLLHFCMFYECAISAQPANINVSLTSLFEGEPYIAINPANPNNIVIAWMADDAFKARIKSEVRNVVILVNKSGLKGRMNRFLYTM